MSLTDHIQCSGEIGFGPDHSHNSENEADLELYRLKHLYLVSRPRIFTRHIPGNPCQRLEGTVSISQDPGMFGQFVCFQQDLKPSEIADQLTV